MSFPPAPSDDKQMINKLIFEENLSKGTRPLQRISPPKMVILNHLNHLKTLLLKIIFDFRLLFIAIRNWNFNNDRVFLVWHVSRLKNP